MDNQKTCSFFVSNSHLLTIILPYINEKTNEGKNINILTQSDLTEDVKKYCKKVKKFNNEKFQKICWKNKEYINENKDNITFVIGNMSYIKNIVLKNKSEETVYCCKIEKIEETEELIKKCNYYLKTDGKVKLIKNSQKGQNSNTIKSQL